MGGGGGGAGGGGRGYQPDYPDVHVKRGMVSRAFIIIRIYNHSIIISVIKRTGEDKDKNPFLRPVFPCHTVHLQMCSTFASSNTLLSKTNSKTV